VRLEERACPFCGAVLEPGQLRPSAVPDPRLGRAALLAFRITLGGSLAAACVASGADRSRSPGGGEGGAGGGTGIETEADAGEPAAAEAKAPLVDAGPTLRMVPIYSDTVVRIRDRVDFAPHSARLPSTADSILRSVARILESTPEMRIEVRGHADAGEGKRAKWLSEQRARGARDRLIQLGARPNQLVLGSFGASEPLPADAVTAFGKSNSRVEFKFLDFKALSNQNGDAEAPP
jgi:outer membrane protein OmpA-like peptidoglycan-associated protein